MAAAPPPPPPPPPPCAPCPPHLLLAASSPVVAFLRAEGVFSVPHVRNRDFFDDFFGFDFSADPQIELAIEDYLFPAIVPCPSNLGACTLLKFDPFTPCLGRRAGDLEGGARFFGGALRAPVGGCTLFHFS